MERRPFTEEQNMFRESARAFFKSEIGPNKERWREAGIIDREAYEKAGETYGGLGLEDFRYEQA